MKPRDLLRRWTRAAARLPVTQGGTRLKYVLTSEEKRRRLVELIQLAQDRVARGEPPRSPSTPESLARLQRLNELLAKGSVLIARNRARFDANGEYRAPTDPVEIG
jgi:hypothetical protein